MAAKLAKQRKHPEEISQKEDKKCTKKERKWTKQIGHVNKSYRLKRKWN
jgi:hypothetical protein